MLKRLFKYKSLIYKVFILLVKYTFLQKYYSDSNFLNRVVLSDNSSGKNSQNFLSISMQPLQKQTRIIDRIINRIYSNANCVIRSLVKRDILAGGGMKTELCFGLYKEDRDIRAHAWLSVEEDAGFSKVYQVS